MIIELTQSDIDSGIRGDLYRHPLALAIGRAIGQPVILEESIITDTQHRTLFEVPSPMMFWASIFDQTGKGRPMKFKLESE